MRFGNFNNIKNGLVLIFISVIGTCFSQDLEEAIYVATERFYQNQNDSTLTELNRQIIQFEPQLSTEDQYFAFINLLVNKAYYLSTKNQQTKAIASYEKAHQLYTKHNVLSYDIVEYCLIPLGILYHKTNAYVKAERLITHYLQLSIKQNNKQHQISGYINLAKLYQSLNKHQQVITIAAKGLQIEGIKKQQERNLNYIKRKSELLLQTNQNQLLLENDLIITDFNIDSIEHLQLQYETALKNEDYELAYSYLIRLKPLKINKLTSARNRAIFSFQEAQLHFKRQKNQKAIAALKNCLAILIPHFNGIDLPKPEDLYPENTFIDIFDLWAELQTEPEKALQSYDLSFYVSQMLNQEYTNQESYIISSGVNKDRSERCIALLYNMYQENTDIEYIKRALNYAERNKALALKWYSDKKSRLEKHPKDSLLIKEQYLLKHQQQLSNKLMNRPANISQLQKQDSLRLQLITTSTELKHLQDTINKTYDNTFSKAVRINSLQSKLKKENSCLVNYFYGKNGLYQFVLSPKGLRFYRINIDTSYQNSIINFIDYFKNASAINNDISQFTNDAFQLYKTLHLNVTSEYKNVVIIADGLLNFIPFESLLTAPTATSKYADMPFMVKTHRIAYHTSVSFYNNTKPYQFNNSLLGVFPVFEDSNSQLTYSINEAEQIDNKINAKFLMYNSATKRAVLREANNYSILHLSTHANSGNFTTAANIDFIDSKLHLQELYNLDLTQDLVVLSACETGVGVLQKGEGSMNLARGFKYAGVSNIIVSLWEINDQSTAQIMSNFYDALRETKSAYAANQNSKLAYLNSKNITNIKKSPYYWSAFIYSGDLTAPETSNYLNIIITCSLLGLIIVFIIWLLIYKKQLWKH